MFRQVGIVCVFAASLAACSEGVTDDGSAAAETPADAKQGLPHKPLKIEQLAGREFAVQAPGIPYESIVFHDEIRFSRINRGAHVSGGEYVLTPDGRLCMVSDGAAASSCWRQLPEGVPKGSAKGTILLQYNPKGPDVLLTPISSVAESDDE